MTTRPNSLDNSCVNVRAISTMEMPRPVNWPVLVEVWELPSVSFDS
jgi:hypothetical protein